MIYPIEDPWKVLFKTRNKFTIDSSAKKSDASSAKRMTSSLDTARLKSFIKILNNKGPKIEPWGTPQSKGILSEVALFIKVTCADF